ncbi:reticulon-like protein B13 [Cornus florida]|uniref:reticulon-like protein B13 n=1 Tax=Cornus florida TaxID=4283 RepID=UPI0028A2C44D|nr:reticulon-like protein B13 [Cornus florida]
MSTATTVQSSLPDTILWRRKKLSLSLLIVATAIWITLEVYQLNFITVASWVALFIVTSAFVWGNFLRLLNKETPDMSGLEITEESAVEMAHTIREWVGRGVQWMLRVGAEGDWFVFARTVAMLLLLSYVGQLYDLLTLLYIGIVVGMTVPVIYEKYEDKFKDCVERLRMQRARFYRMIDEKVVRKVKNKGVGDQQKKEKKTE